MKQLFIIGAISMVLFSCSEVKVDVSSTSIHLLGSIKQNDSSFVRFNAELSQDTLYIRNGLAETITVVLSGEDTLKGSFPVFASDLWLLKSEQGYIGEFYRTDAENYRLPLEFVEGVIDYPNATTEWPAQYAINRMSQEGNVSPALLQLGLTEGVLTGSIATSTGDSRFLTGWETEAGFQLQGFDGRFIYNVIAHVIGDSVWGNVYSGKTGYYSFQGRTDDQAVLEDPKTMTELAPDYSHIEWHLPDLNGDTIHFDSRNITKPTILAIQGSWCPNCMDEGRVLDDFYREFNGDIEVYGLSYEYSGTLEKATEAVQKMKRDLGISFPMVIATYSAKQDANSILPLQRIRSYPTSILLDAKGNVISIHTGFYGPSTREYDGYVNHMRVLLTDLVVDNG
jgi:thiol-disulfide isomerase/thioredoxin